MAALNLTFLNFDGLVVHGDSLTMDYHAGWETRSSPLGGSISELSEEQLDMIHPSSTNHHNEKGNSASAQESAVATTDGGTESVDESGDRPVDVVQESLSEFIEN